MEHASECAVQEAEEIVRKMLHKAMENRCIDWNEFQYCQGKGVCNGDSAVAMW